MSRPQQSGVYPYHYERDRALHAFRQHQVTIEYDEGVYRSVSFRDPCSFAYHFRLTTWPGHLAISGDIGDYVFCRLHDMFEFFASATDWASMPLEINASYWEEKCVAHDRHGGTKEFDEDGFKRYIIQTFREADFWEYDEGTRAAVWRDVRSDLLENDFNDQRDAIQVAQDFRVPSWRLRTSASHSDDWWLFQDVWECSFTKPSFHYLICCYAIAWGIKRYAQVKSGRDTGAATKRMLSKVDA